MASTPGFEPGPHWWEVSALTTAPPLLPLSIGRFHAFAIFFPFLGNVLNTCMGNPFWISKAFTNDQGLGISPSFDEYYPWLLLKKQEENRTKRISNISHDKLLADNRPSLFTMDVCPTR